MTTCDGNTKQKFTFKYQEMKMCVCVLYVYMSIFNIHTNIFVGNRVYISNKKENDKIHYVRGNMQQGLLLYYFSNIVP